MPKLFEYLGIIVLFYSNEHEPVHVHGKYQGHESKAEFEIVDGRVTAIHIVNVRGRRPLPPAQLKEFRHLVRVFADDIVQKWIDYFVYHRDIRCITIEGKIK